MSEPTTPKPEPAAQLSTRPRFTIANILIGIFIGILIGVAGYHYMQGNLEKITQVLLTASYVAFAALIVSLVAMLAFRQYLTRSILGSGADKVGTVIQDAQKAADHLTDRVAAHLLRDAPEDIQQGARSILPRLLNLFFWGRLRNWWWQWIIGIFVSIGGLTGTMLLMNQNELLGNQNVLLDTQNTLIQRQMLLEEANRRSALVVLMSNIMDKVDREIEKQQDLLPIAERDSARFQLSQSLIGQIAALSHSFKPYRYMNGDTLITEPLSPERGQLLITLSLLPIDNATLNKIHQSAIFQDADLQNAMFERAYLYKANLARANFNRSNLAWANLIEVDFSQANLALVDFFQASLIEVNLFEANLAWANLKDANLFRVNLSQATLMQADLAGLDLTNVWLDGTNLSQADLSEANLSNLSMFDTNLSEANLTKANLSEANLTKANLSEANLMGANLTKANLSEANLMGADLSGADLTGASYSIEQLKLCFSLYRCNGLSNSVLKKLKKEKPRLFDELENFDLLINPPQ